MRRMADPRAKLDKACATMRASYQIGRRPKRPVPEGLFSLPPPARGLASAHIFDSELPPAQLDRLSNAEKGDRMTFEPEVD
jgi:hypothetical protein